MCFERTSGVHLESSALPLMLDGDYIQPVLWLNVKWYHQAAATNNPPSPHQNNMHYDKVIRAQSLVWAAMKKLHQILHMYRFLREQSREGFLVYKAHFKRS